VGGYPTKTGGLDYVLLFMLAASMKVILLIH